MMNLVNARKAMKKTQQEMADYLGISRQAYSNYETGKREPDYETLLKLGEYLDCSIDYESEGRGFESLPAHLKRPQLRLRSFFVPPCWKETRTGRRTAVRRQQSGGLLLRPRERSLPAHLKRPRRNAEKASYAVFLFCQNFDLTTF